VFRLCGGCSATEARSPKMHVCVESLPTRLAGQPPIYLRSLDSRSSFLHPPKECRTSNPTSTVCPAVSDVALLRTRPLGILIHPGGGVSCCRIRLQSPPPQKKQKNKRETRLQPTSNPNPASMHLYAAPNSPADWPQVPNPKPLQSSKRINHLCSWTCMLKRPPTPSQE